MDHLTLWTHSCCPGDEPVYNLVFSSSLGLLVGQNRHFALTDSKEEGGTSSLPLFYWLSISSVTPRRTATKSYTLHASSCRTHWEMCAWVWLWLIFILCGRFLWVISFCCDVQCAIRKHGWKGELHSKTWCIAFWTVTEFTTKWRYGGWKAENQLSTIKYHKFAPPYYQNDH